MQWESGKDKGTRDVGATRNWHRTEWDLTPGLLGQGIPITPASPAHVLQVVYRDWWLGHSPKESILVRAKGKLAQNHKYSSGIQSD